MLTVGEVMQRDAPTVSPEDDVETVVRQMRSHDLHGVPVVNEGGRCVGIITDADLVFAEDDGALHLPHYIELFGGIVFLESMKHFEERLRKAVAARAKDLMTPDPVTVAPEDTVQEAARVISRTGHNRLPVAEHGRYVGVITRVDVLEALTRD